MGKIRVASHTDIAEYKNNLGKKCTLTTTSEINVQDGWATQERKVRQRCVKGRESFWESLRNAVNKALEL